MTFDLTRRSLLGALALSAAAPLAARAGKGSAPRYGVQLYPLQREFLADMPGLFAKLAAMGFTGVEFAGFGSHQPADIRRALADAGLKPLAAHCLPLNLSDDEAQRDIDLCAAIGIPMAVTALPGLRPTPERPKPSRAAVFDGMTVDDLAWSAERMTAFSRLARARGLAYGYHTHNIDFRLVEGQTGLDHLMRLTPPSAVLLQVDIGNAVVAGADPLPLLRKYRGRIASVHVKEWQAGFTPTFTYRFPPTAAFGEGSTDWRAVMAATAAAGVRDIVVEQEISPGIDSLGAQQQALGYLRGMAAR